MYRFSFSRKFSPSKNIYEECHWRKGNKLSNKPYNKERIVNTGKWI